MTPESRGDTRKALLEAAARLISASPGQDIPLRAICDEVGVKLPTLYHFFGSKEGLLDAVIERGFDLYIGVKQSHESSGDPIQDIRDGWNAHVAFGLANPGFYVLMYGQVTPGRRPAAQQRPTSILVGLTRAADAQGRLVVDSEQAADHILAANVGVTLHLITSGQSGLGLSTAMCEATIAGITGEHNASRDITKERDSLQQRASHLLRAFERSSSPLDRPETVLLKKWLHTIGSDPG